MMTPTQPLVYIGTYTKTSSQGIYVGRFDSATGRLGEFILAAEAENPTFLCLSPDHRQLYAISETTGASYQGKPSGQVNAYTIQPDGRLAWINTTVSAGQDPCHISVTPDGANVLVANYNGGTVALLPVRADGGLDDPATVDQHEGKSIHPQRQDKPYAHSINPSNDGRFAFAANLGTDNIYIYRIDMSAHTMAPTEPASVSLEPGSGPRHLAKSADGRRAYVINELGNTLMTFALDAEHGTLELLQTVPTLPPEFTAPNTAAEVAVHPNGCFVYGANRGHDSLAVFAVDPATGTLTLIEHVSSQGKTPRHFAIDPSGRWLIVAHQDSDSLVVFSVDPATGRLTATGQTVALAMPVCVRFC